MQNQLVCHMECGTEETGNWNVQDKIVNVGFVEQDSLFMVKLGVGVQTGNIFFFFFSLL